MADPRADAWRRTIAEWPEQFDGCHYLRGTAGNTPGLGNGFTAAKRTAAKLKPDMTDMAKEVPQAVLRCIGVGAGYCEIPSLHVCCGAYRGALVGNVAQSFSNPQREGPLLRHWIAWNAAGQPDIFEYISAWRRTASDPSGVTDPGPQTWFLYVWPRRVIADYDAVAETNGRIIWGSGCVGERHFDCVGLVNAAIAKALDNDNITMDMWVYAQASNCDDVTASETVEPGDLVLGYNGPANEMQNDRKFIVPGRDADDETKQAFAARARRWHHIGIALGDGKGSVVQAEEGPVGVTMKSGLIGTRGQLSGAVLNFRGRLKDDVLASWSTFMKGKR